MGLDMYLSKKSCVKNWKHEDEKEHFDITIKKGGKAHPAIQPSRISYIIEEVAYWRKANQIHQWLVDNVQDGEDNCLEYDVTTEHLEELLKIINKVLKDHDKAHGLLPVSQGFFFGGKEYDEYYFEQLEYTQKTIKKLLAEDGYGCFCYQSSW